MEATSAQNLGFPIDFDSRPYNSVTHYRATLWSSIESRTRAFDWHRKQWPWTMPNTKIGVLLIFCDFSLRRIFQEWMPPARYHDGYQIRPGRPRTVSSTVNKDLQKIWFSNWEKAEVAAFDKHGNMNGVAVQCVHVDAGGKQSRSWSRSQVIYRPNST